MSEQTPRARFEFSEGRRTAETAIAELMAATGRTAEDLVAAIPELGRDNLSFGVAWESDTCSNSETGRALAAAVAPFIHVRIPTWNVEGVSQDMAGINRAHLINTEDGAVRSFEDFGGGDEWLWSPEGPIAEALSEPEGSLRHALPGDLNS